MVKASDTAIVRGLLEELDEAIEEMQDPEENARLEKLRQAAGDVAKSVPGRSEPSLPAKRGLGEQADLQASSPQARSGGSPCAKAPSIVCGGTPRLRPDHLCILPE